MRRRLIIVGVLVILVGVGIGVWLWLATRSSGEGLVLYGNVDVRQVNIAFRVPGRVIEMPFQEGDLVEPGQLMGVLDDEPYADQVTQAVGTLEAVARRLQFAEEVLERRAALLGIGDGSISEEDYQNALSNRDALMGELTAARGAEQTALTNLRDTQVLAPNKGTILTRVVEPGAVVAAGGALYTLSLVQPIWIRAYVAEPELGLVYPGMEAEITTDTKENPVYRGHVGFISPVAEFTPKTVETTQLRTDLVYRLRVIIDGGAEGLLQGMPVTVRLLPKKEGHEPSSSSASL
jgi:membrane fusion protein YbhG